MYYRRKKRRYDNTKSLVDEYLKKGGVINKIDTIEMYSYFIEHRYSDVFYKTDEWKAARNKFLSDYYYKNEGKYTCSYCEHPLSFEKQEREGNLLLVDHIKPVRKFWYDRLNPENFAICCGKCNELKCNRVFGADMEYDHFIRIAKRNRKLYNEGIEITYENFHLYM